MALNFPDAPGTGDTYGNWKYDGAKWVGVVGALPTGDITGVIAGAGLSGGGSTGDVTLSLATPVPIASGGTGQASAAAALTALNGLPLTGGTLTGPPVQTPILELKTNNASLDCELKYTVSGFYSWKVGIQNIGDYYIVDETGVWMRMILATNGTNYCVNGAWTTFSDARLKRDVTDYPHGLAEICSLRPVSFTYAGSPLNKDGDQQFGLIAQDVEPHLPELVGEYYYDPAAQPGEPGPGAITEPMMLKTLDSGRLVFALVNAVRELAERVAALEARAE